MTKIIQILIIGLMSLAMSQASAQQTITEAIAVNKLWAANKVSGHQAWGTEACVATTPLSQVMLEVYSEKTESGFAEPTIQILFKDAPQIYSAELSTDKGGRWIMTLASAPTDPNIQAVISRLKDREEIVRYLKLANSAVVKLRDVKNKAFQQAQFSLSGSSKTIDSLFSSCALKFEDVP